MKKRVSFLTVLNMCTVVQSMMAGEVFVSAECSALVSVGEEVRGSGG